MVCGGKGSAGGLVRLPVAEGEVGSDLADAIVGCLLHKFEKFLRLGDFADGIRDGIDEFKGDGIGERSGESVGFGYLGGPRRIDRRGLDGRCDSGFAGGGLGRFDRSLGGLSRFGFQWCGGRVTHVGGGWWWFC